MTRAMRRSRRVDVVPRTCARTSAAIEAPGGAAKISGAGGLHGEGAGLLLVVHEDPESLRRR